MKILVPTEKINLDYYNNIIKNINLKYNTINLIGDEVQDYIYDRKQFYSVTTSNLNINLDNILLNELFIINNYNINWKEYIKEKQYLLIYQSENIIICTSEFIYRIIIYLKDVISKSLFSYKNILTYNGFEDYNWDKELCFEGFEDLVNHNGLKQTKIQYNLYNYLSNLYKNTNIIQNFNFTFNIKEFYNFYCLNIQNCLNFFNFDYINKNDNLNFTLYFERRHHLNFFNKITDIIGDNNYTPIYLIQNNWCIQNGYSFFNLKNKKILAIHIDKYNNNDIILYFPKQYFHQIEKLKLNYQNYNKDYYSIIANNPMDIYIILQTMEKLINVMLYKNYKIKPNEGIINVSNN